MQATPGRGPNPQLLNQFAPVELPSKYQGAGNPNGPANTGFRHELAEQTSPQISQRGPPLSFPPFTIPTVTDSLSSGFPYTQHISEFRVSREQWHQFSAEIVDAAKLSFTEDAAAWAKGVGTGAASTAVLLVFGPAVGYYAGKTKHKKALIKKVREQLGHDGLIRKVLRTWNEGAFRERGIQVWLEVPLDETAVDVNLDMNRREKEEKKLARSFKIIVQADDPTRAPLGMSLGGDVSPLTPSSQQGQWSAGSSPSQGFMKPYMGPGQQGQGGWGSQQPLGYGGKPMVQELPGSRPYGVPLKPGWGNQQYAQSDGKQMVQELAGSEPFIAELDAGNESLQRPPNVPPKVPPKDQVGKYSFG